MKRKFPLYGAVLAGMLYLSPTSASAEDISKHWAYHEMNYLITNDLMKEMNSAIIVRMMLSLVLNLQPFLLEH